MNAYEKKLEISQMLRKFLLVFGTVLSLTHPAWADERHFAYSYEADAILPRGEKEFESWVTHRSGRGGGTFSRWDLREEVEYGLTEHLTTALYLNVEKVYSDGLPDQEDEDSFEVKGISSEWKYMISSPHLNPIGILGYAELSVEEHETELEEKLILEHILNDTLILALNIVLEQEWNDESGETEKEAFLELTAGISCPINPHWSVGLEGRNVRAFPDGLDYGEQESSAWFFGPNFHYGSDGFSVTCAILPQVHGTPDTRNGLFLEDHEKLELRLIAGVSL